MLIKGYRKFRILTKVATADVFVSKSRKFVSSALIHQSRPFQQFVRKSKPASHFLLSGVIATILVLTSGNAPGQCKSKQGSSEDDFIDDFRERNNSLRTLEQVFNEYASVELGGEKFLTRGDFLEALLCRSLIFVDRKELKKKCSHYDHPLLGSGKFHLINFTEFKILVSLLSVPLPHIRVVFKALDVDHSGGIDKDEFYKLIERLMSQHDKATLEASLQETHLVLQWFGQKGDKSVTLTNFEEFVKQVTEDLNIIELQLYSFVDDPREFSGKGLRFLKRISNTFSKTDSDRFENEYLTARNLAFTLINTNSSKTIHSSLAALDHIEVPNKKIPLRDALNLHRALSIHCYDIMDSLDMYLEANGGKGIDFPTFERAVQVACRASDSPSDVPRKDLLQLIFTLWDQSRDGYLDYHEILFGIMEKRGLQLGVERAAPGIKRLTSCLLGKSG